MISSLSKKGFTLIELLIVIAVVGILAAGVVVAINPAEKMDKARLAGAKTFYSQVVNNMDFYAAGSWKFDDEANPGKDTSGNNNNGTLTAGPTFVANCDLGLGGCMSFDGVDDYVSVNGASLAVGNSFTYSLWVKYGGPSTYQWPYLLGYDSHKYPGIRGGNNYGAGQPSLEWGTDPPTCGGASFTNLSLPSVIDRKWHYIVFIYDGAEVKGYFDGKYQNKKTQIGMCPNSSHNIGYKYNGMIDEVNIYSSVLTQTEIEKKYAEGLLKKFTNLAINIR